MTERLYYENQRLTDFRANVVEHLERDGHPAVVLDRTAFYPASGGQPSDRGSINGVAVLDVIVTDSGDVVHLLAEDVTGERVEGVLDWARRFDHMQQHSGQHILSAAFEKLGDAETVGFHLGRAASTIDLNVSRLDPELAGCAEELTNRVIWENRPMIARFVDDDDVGAMDLRRDPEAKGRLRIVSVLGPSGELGAPFDANPCGGTHVAATGEIGLLKLVRLDRRGDQTRVEFVCGGRAWLDYAAKHSVVTELAARLTVGYWELGAAVNRVEGELNAARRELKDVKARLADYEARELIGGATLREGCRLVLRVLGNRPAAELGSLARKVAETSDTVALLASTGDRTQLCFARAEGVDVDVAALLQQVCANLGGKGGGRPHLAQGSAPATSAVAVHHAIRAVAARAIGGGG